MKKKIVFPVQDLIQTLDRLNIRINRIENQSTTQEHEIYERDMNLHALRNKNTQNLNSLKHQITSINDELRNINRTIHAIGIRFKDSARKAHVDRVRERIDSLNYEFIEQKTPYPQLREQTTPKHSKQRT
ncbi:hypothetical protein CMO92_00420 [Candidatus Woesearchaeota archaeon]|nr:hypothetical protein [Candidatus Woesearchaeota archaeon]|tara:strand:+ start:1166 stop:1555 length:390 start_codon:yes stop_codon:yes gene_type:complete